ncbi:hypothetical protein ID866_3869 [Astraeus odoratus]|nr:hypothetical protein ID866_3869 [Astraeus odoratus]
MSTLAYDSEPTPDGQSSVPMSSNGLQSGGQPSQVDANGLAYNRNSDDSFHTGLSSRFARHPNLSTTSIPSHPPPDYDTVAQSQSYSANSLVDSMNSMHIRDPTPHGMNLSPIGPDPLLRPGTSMSMQNPRHRAPPHPSRYPTLPPAPNATLPLHVRRPGDPHSQYAADDLGVAYHQRGDQPPNRNSGGYGGAHPPPVAETDIVGLYAFDDQGSGSSSAYPQSDASSTHSQPSQYGSQYQMGWHGSQPNLAANYGHPAPPRAGEYDHFYAAASDVLGMGPPPQSHANTNAYHPYHGYPNQVPVQASQSVPYVPPGGPGSYHAGPPGPGASNVAPYGLNPSPPQGLGVDEAEFELRSPATSVNVQAKKTKAVDLNAPPFTKEYIDEYRQRIKGDPDPEAHFKYSKYLIEAAKKIGSDARDQRAVKKYRDFLIQEALKTIRRLATQTEPYDEAQFFLANCYGTGMLGLQVDHERAYHLYLQAAKQNHAAASYRVAVCNEIGAGTRREPPRAAAFYKKAASLGDTAAMYKLGMILLLGTLGEQKNPRDAINWLKRAAEQADEENPHALHELAMLHEMPNSGLVPHDPAYAKALYTQAAHLGYAQSQYKLGQCYEYGALTCPVDPRRSIAWYTKAAEKGYSEAELALSGWYLTGSEGVLKQSDSEAYLWARKAANKGLSKAEYAVGYYAEVGIGIKQDIEFAKRWYMRAAAQGNKRAMSRLTEMKRMGNKRSNFGRPTRQQAKDDLDAAPVQVTTITKLDTTMATTIKDEVSLLEHLDVSQINCLNEQHGHDLKSIVASKIANPRQSLAYLESDADEQLLINIHFNQAVRIRKLVIRCKVAASGPKTIKLRVNQPSISFSDVEGALDSAFAQVLELNETDITEGKPVALRFIFVESNQGDEEHTRIDAIDVLGTPVEATKDLSGLRQEEH